MPVQLTVGSRLGSAYILDGPVGAGAQGEVWLAHADAAPHTPLAVKILRADLVEDPGVVERFIRERSTLMRVRSPYVVGVRDMVIEGTRFAIIMDHVGGGDLRDRLTDVGPLAPAEVARVGAMLAQGLAAVHAADIVHRDLKPANVLIDDSAPTPPAAQTPPAAPDRSSAEPSDRNVSYGVYPGATMRYGTAGGAAPADPGATDTPYGTVGTGLPADGAAGASPSPVTPDAAAAPGSGAAQDSASGASSSADTATTATWVPRLADFGVARLCDTVSASLATGAIGTPLYMAPEILDSTAPTPASDIYSLGVVLYEASCGVTPFVGAPSQVLASHLRFIPGRPDGVPEALWSLIVRMLAKQPTERPTAAAVAEELRRMAPALAGLPAARRLEEPPQVSLCDAPFVPRSAEDSISTRTGASPTPSGTTVPPGTGGAAAPHAGARAVGYGVHAQPLPGSTAQVPPAQTSPAPAAPAARRRRGWLIGAVVTVILCLVGTGLWVWWSRGRGAGRPTTLAALPAQARLVEIQRIPESWEFTGSPDGGALAVEDFDEWSLYDLSAVDHSAVWSGECMHVRFWTNTQILCESADADTLVSLDGSETTELPGPAKRSFVGTTGAAAIVVDDSFEGSLVAIDAAGTELWRRDGGYQKGLVTEHFITTYESGSGRLQVLSAATGEILLSEPLDSAPGFDTERPGGVGTDVGGEAFYVERSGAVTVYDATGAEVGVVNDSPSRTRWAASAPLSPEELVDLLKTASQGGVAVRGARSTVTIDIDTTACTATGPDAVSYPVPERADGEACVITPLGLVGDDSAVLFSMGQPSTRSGATGEQLIAYDLDDGQPTWQTIGTLVGPLPSSAQALGKPRLLLVQPGRGDDDLVIVAVIAQ